MELWCTCISILHSSRKFPPIQTNRFFYFNIYLKINIYTQNLFVWINYFILWDTLNFIQCILSTKRQWYWHFSRATDCAYHIHSVISFRTIAIWKYSPSKWQTKLWSEIPVVYKLSFSFGPSIIHIVITEMIAIFLNIPFLLMEHPSVFQIWVVATDRMVACKKLYLNAEKTSVITLNNYGRKMHHQFLWRIHFWESKFKF